MVKYNFKTIITAMMVFIIGAIAAFLLDEKYRQFIRFLYKMYNGDKIQFIGKNFHFFASEVFVLSAGLFFATAFLLLQRMFRSDWLKNLGQGVLIFFLLVLVLTFIDSKAMVMECTACKDGIRNVSYNAISYDKYFLIGVFFSLCYWIIKLIRQKKT